ERAKAGAAARGKRVTFSLPTNATLLDAETARWLFDEGVQIFLSIDGDADAQRGRPLRSGKNSHHLAMAGLRAARGAIGQAPAVRMTVTSENAVRLAKNVAFFANEGVLEILAYPTFDQVWTREELDGFARGQEALARWLVAALDASVDPRGEVPELRAWQPILRSLLPSGQRRRRSGMLSYCGAGDELLAVRIDGRLSPCHRFVFYDDRAAPRFDMGYLPGSQPSGEAPGPLPNAETRALSSLRVEEMRGKTRCVDCDIYDHCTIGCVAIGVATTGDPAHVSPSACDLQRAQVDACRLVVKLLGAEDPRLLLYLGQSLTDTLTETSARLGTSAWRHYSFSE
ncbi:MAG: hypothetical protein KAI47_11490, partial [Deltaproteobacteria bacterium]|nr:hypothetical protein [Deltaproteobacteria bacterium]